MLTSFFSKEILGIDIGTSAIKMVELSKLGKKIRLENYVEVPTSLFQQQEAQSREKSIIFLPSEEIAGAIRFVLDEAKIKTKNCVFAIPDFLTFFTTFSLPPMSKEEMEPAIKMEARKYIPVPIKEVTLDWQVIKESKAAEESSFVLLVAVPNEIIYKYQKIAILSNLKVIALEAEVFGLIKIVSKKEVEKNIAIIDFGAKSTTCSIIEKGALKTYHSINISSWVITEKLARGLGIDWQLAEKIKKNWGLSNISFSLTPQEKEVYKSIFVSALNPLLEEINRIFRNFYLKEGKEIDKIILAGGISLIPDILQFFNDYFKKEVEIINPFSGITFLPELEAGLNKIGPSFGVAVGVALRHLVK